MYLLIESNLEITFASPRGEGRIRLLPKVSSKNGGSRYCFESSFNRILARKNGARRGRYEIERERRWKVKQRKAISGRGGPPRSGPPRYEMTDLSKFYCETNRKWFGYDRNTSSPFWTGVRKFTPSFLPLLPPPSLFGRDYGPWTDIHSRLTPLFTVHCFSFQLHPPFTHPSWPLLDSANSFAPPLQFSSILLPLLPFFRSLTLDYRGGSKIPIAPSHLFSPISSHLHAVFLLLFLSRPVV